MGTGGSGTVVDSEREVGAFDALEVGSGLQVALAVGDTTGVVVRADDNVQDLVVAEVEDGTLTLEVDGSVRDATLEATVTVPADALTAVTLAEAASLTDTDPLTSSQIRLDLDGAARAFMVLEVGSLVVDAQGASVLNASGTAQRLDLTADGASTVTLGELSVPQASVTVRGASRAAVTVTEQLEASASGASRITYGGDPGQVDEDADDTSRIRAE
jgi:hypothetical protein